MVLDASVGAKWCLPDEPHEGAAALLDKHQRNQVNLLVPDLFWPELTAVLARAVRRGRIKPPAAERSLEVVRALDMPTHPTGGLSAQALSLSVQWQLPSYDFFYVLLAQSLGDEMITADERLVRTLGSRFPVRWLDSLV